MKVTISVLLIVIPYNSTGAEILNVPAGYFHIQAGIEEALNGDTVLVQPGIYIENINFKGKSIVVGSLFLTTGDTSYISQTVIDGNQNGSVARFTNGEDSTSVLCGFTLTNGSGTFASLDGGALESHGGGVFCRNSNPKLCYLNISKNRVNGFGGGFYCGAGSKMTLEEITIIDNVAKRGGGLQCGSNSTLLLYKISVLRNTAIGGAGGGIFFDSYSKTRLMQVKVSKNSASGVYASGGGILFSSYPETILENVMITENTITGIVSDDLNRLDGAGMSLWYGSSPVLRNVTVRGNVVRSIDGWSTGGGIHFAGTPKPILKDVRITDNIVQSTSGWCKGGGIYFSSESEPSITDANISNNTVIGGMFNSGGGIYFDFKNNATMTNVTINRNISEGPGAGIYFSFDNNPILSYLTISNNSANRVERPIGGGLFFDRNCNPVIVNTTIFNNSGNGINVHQVSKVAIVNSILWNNRPFEIYSGGYNTLNIAHSDFQDDKSRIEINRGKLNWLDGNIGANPQFIDPENGDYHLSENSPCIEAGTAYFEWDDIRIEVDSDDYFGMVPDMGAHESSIIVEVNENNRNQPMSHSIYQNYPNPFNPTTTIQFELEEGDYISLAIYDITGKLVKELLSDELHFSGVHQVQWDGTNGKGLPVSSGLYLYEMKTTLGFKSARRMILVR